MVSPSPAYAESRSPKASLALVALFALTVGISAFLLFQVQLLVTKYILPWFGGVASVFTTCMLFFQVALLAGYAYSHLLVRRRSRSQRIIHVALLLFAAAVLAIFAVRWPSPITPGTSWRPAGSDAPVGHILLLLAASVGLPFFTLSTTGPLLQAWSAQTFPTSSPYRWYALSNLGSLLGLISYPLLFEPLLTLKAQAWIWSLAYLVFAGCCITVASLTLKATRAEIADTAGSVTAPERITVARRLLWFLLPACAAMILLATTNQVCQEVASVPFLWVLPLTLYLLSFVICFDHPRRYSRTLWTIVLAVATSGACFALYGNVSKGSMLAQIALYALFVLAACMVCHGEVFRLRPDASHLTAFYLTIAAGGAAAGVFVGALAPVLFTGYWELPLAVWMIWLLFFSVQLREKDSWVQSPPSWAPLLAFVVIAVGPLVAWFDQLREHAQLVALFAALVVLAWFAQLVTRRVAHIGWVHFVPIVLVGLGVVLLGYIEVHSDAVARSRNFYGSLLVLRDDSNHPSNATLELRHGRITHGTQFLVPTKRHMPTTYYGPDSGVGVAILNHPNRAEGYLRIGVVGLGTGTLATYGRRGDYIRFYEINPEVLRLAETYFTYLKDTPAHVDVVLGDARLSMERELERGEPQLFDVLALDAFNSDSIPVHLLTREAFAIYLKHLDPHGIIAVHVSNQTLDLEPLVHELADHFHLASCWISDTQDDSSPYYSSSWVLVSPDLNAFDDPNFSERAEQFSARRVRLWTDDFSNLVSVIHR